MASLERSVFQKKKKNKKQTNKNPFQMLSNKIVMQIIDTGK